MTTASADALVVDAPALPLADVDGVVDVRSVGDGDHVAITTTLDVDEVATLDGVLAVEPDRERYPATDYFPLQWALRNTNRPEVDLGWDEARIRATGDGVVVAVLDTAFDLDHPDLAGQLWTNPGEVCGNGTDDDANGYVDDCTGWDFPGGDADVDTDDPAISHGTHVAGTVLAADDGANVIGVAPNARLMPLKVFGDDGRAWTSDVAAAIRYAADNGADVINMSLAGKGWGTVERDAVDDAAAAGITLVAAAGNDSTDLSTTPYYPAAYPSPSMISVGAHDRYDAQSTFSNYSATLVDVHAPGTAIYSSLSGGGVAGLQGTSMAAPHVAGVAALLVERGLTGGAAIRQQIMDSAQPVAALAGMSVTGGRVSAAAALGVPTDGSIGFDIDVDSVTDAVADTADTATITAVAHPAARRLDAATLQATIGIIQDGTAYAVEGLAATIDGVAHTTGTDGVLPLGTHGDAALAAGATVEVTWSLPSARYAMVLEARDGSGQRLARSYVAFDVAAPTGPAAFAAVGDSQVSYTPATDAVAHAIATSRDRFADRSPAHVVVASADTFADALAGTPLTGEGPLLFAPAVDDGTSYAAVQTEIDRLLGGSGTVYILGGAAATAFEPTSDYDARRLAGDSRVETAAVVAAEVSRLYGTGEQVLVGRAHGVEGNASSAFADSLTAGGYAAATRTPVLLTPTEHVHRAVAAYLSSHSPRRTVLLGGTAAIGPAVEAVVPGPRRVAGDTRDLTAVSIADDLWSTDAGADRIVIEGFTDSSWTWGLLAAGHAADGSAPILLTHPDGVPTSTRAAVTASGGTVHLTGALTPGQAAALTADLDAAVAARPARPEPEEDEEPEEEPSDTPTEDEPLPPPSGGGGPPAPAPGGGGGGGGSPVLTPTPTPTPSVPPQPTVGPLTLHTPGVGSALRDVATSTLAVCTTTTCPGQPVID